MRVRYNDFEDYELDDMRAMRRLMHEKQREGLRLSNKRRKLKGPRDQDWDDDDWTDGDYDDFDDYNEEEFDRHSGLS
jgi:hypothetical protein